MSPFETTLQFASAEDKQGIYRLLELPAELLKLVEEGQLKGQAYLKIGLDCYLMLNLSLCIKGNANDDAVLCTSEKTYSLRSITLSNSLLLTTPHSGHSTAMVVRHQASEILELLPTVPRIERLDAMFKHSSYGEADGGDSSRTDENLKRYTYEDLSENVQASDGELTSAMQARHILSIKGELRTLSPTYLNEILTLILNCLVAKSLQTSSADVQIITEDLHAMHDVIPEVTIQVLKWYGEVDSLSETWCCDRDSIVKEVGIGLLRQRNHDFVTERELLESWKTAVGDTFEENVHLDLLTGNFILEDSSVGNRLIKYFAASSLPSDPKARFTDLFLTRARWRQEDILPFIEGITVSSKDRDRMLLKFTRSTKDRDGTVWLTAIHK